ncbi:MAG: dihydrolipoyl dehydrogenase [Phycisphaerae bacterium]|nr:dihydrolipoyl dehydrogenase [Phycisphaerae bacterium]
MSKNFDIAVLGAGPGGYVAALRAAAMGAKVAIVEKHYLGGTCLNYGCIPSKALLASAGLMDHLKHADDFGVNIDGVVGFDWGRVQARKDKVVSTLRTGIKGLLGARKATLFQGKASLNGVGKVVVKKENGESEEFTADKIILAVGSIPARIPGWPTDVEKVCTSDESLHWKTLPKSLLIVGGGVIGCEFACMMEPFGVKVTIVEMLPYLLPNMDKQLGDTLEKSFAKRGIKSYVNVKIEELTTTATGVRAKLSNGEVIEADKALVATGRRPNTAEIGLETVGLATDRGFIRVNDHMETAVKGYYCIGDANGRCLLAHAASAQGIAAVENALGHSKAFTSPIPGCVYTFPEIGSVGLSVEECKAKNIPVSIGHFPLSFLGKAMAAGDTEGFVKVIRNRETDELLGVHMMGHNATECIAAAGAMLHQKASATELAEVVFAHPTMSEGIKESAEDVFGMCLHQPPRKVMKIVVGS